MCFLHIPDLILTLVPVRFDNLLQIFKNWGPEYKIEFDITVTKLPNHWANVFHFTHEGTDSKFLSLMINGETKKFRIEEKFTEPHYWDISIELNKKYHFVIETQYIANTRYRFNILVDKNRIAHEDFTKKPAPLVNVLLYASDPWKTSSFDYEHGTLENFTVITSEIN